MKTWFTAVLAGFAVMVGANVARACDKGVSVGYSHNVGVAVSYVPVSYPVAMAYPVAAPVVADPIPFKAEACEPAVSAPAMAAPLCVQAVSAPVAYAVAAPTYSYSVARVAVQPHVQRVAVVQHHAVQRVAVANVHHNVGVVRVNNVRNVRVNNVRVANNRVAVNAHGVRVSANGGGAQRVNVKTRNGLLGQRVTVRAR